MVTAPTRRGWHRGIMSAVRLAAWMPAIRAAPSTSPLVMALLATLPVVSGCMKTLHRETARRCVASFGVTSTMRARPSGSRCVRLRSDMGAVYPGAGPAGLSADLAHAPGGPDEMDLADGVARPFATHLGFDGLRQVIIAAATPQDGPQIRLPH